MSTSRIEWTDATWNPIVGCTRCSPACDHCYAVRMAHRLESNPQTPQYKGLTRMSTILDGERGPIYGPEWTGEVRCLESELSRPLKWRKPRRIFVGSMTDMFHPNVPFEFLDRIFAVMSLCPQHTFQVLTKRPERMLEYLTRDDVRLSIRRNAEIIGRHLPDNHPGFSRYNWEVDDLGEVVPIWPRPNVWLGVTPTKDQDIATLLQCPAVIHYVSIEPMLRAWDLTAIDFPEAMDQEVRLLDALRGMSRDCEVDHNALSWVICGGETGPGARPMRPNWVRSLRDQCEAAGVAFFFKSWGEWAPWDDDNWSLPAGADDVLAHDRAIQINGVEFLRVGKKAAGRILDGRTWEQFPEVGR